MSILYTIKILWRVFRKYRRHITTLVVLGFLGAVVEGIGINAIIPLASFLNAGAVAPTDFISRFIQNVFSFFDIPFKFRYVLGLILSLFMLRAVANVVFGYVRGWIMADFYENESRTLLRGVIRASWPFLLRQKLGHIHSTMVRDLQRTSGLLGTISQIIQSMTGFLMYLLVAMNISPWLTLMTALGGAVLVGIVRPLTRRLQQMGGQMASTERDISQFLSEHIIGMKTVKVVGAEEKAISMGSKLMTTLRALQTRSALTHSLSSSVFQPFSIMFVLVLFSVMYRMPGFSFVSFAAALYLIQKIFTYLESAQTSINGLIELLPYAENLTNFKRVLAENSQREGSGTAPFVFAHELKFEHVSFAYSTEGKQVLKDVSFTVRRGETVGLIGPSGAGKTSIADIILRLFHPASGTLTLDEVAVEDIALSEWRSHIGYVSQDLFLFNGSIEENIRFYRQELSMGDIHTAAKQANIYDFVMSLPEAFASQVGDRGVMLSGGQRQRVALARALVGRPSILVLDEATSALDSESERFIQEAINQLRGQITVFIIAHRLSTVENADMILVIDNGEILEQGSPENLRRDQSSYFAKHSRKHS